MKIQKSFSLTLILFFVVFTACQKSKNAPEDTGYLHGIFIVNEGTFQNNNGSIGFLKRDSSNLHPHIFLTANSHGPGDIIQSFSISEDLGFIVANNSEKLEVVDLETFTSLHTIHGADYPRYFLAGSNGKGYLTNGAFAGNVFVIDLDTFLITNSIPVGNGPENLVLSNGKIFVANSGGWLNDSTVSVIEIQVDQVIKTIHTGDNPTDLVADANGNIWVLCKGKVIYDQNWNIVEETDSKLVMIDKNSLSVTKTFVVGRKGDYFSPTRLEIDGAGQTLYYVEREGIYKMGIDDQAVPGNVFIQGTFYGLGVDPENGMIYGLDAKDFAGNGVAHRFDKTGTPVDSLQVGMVPNGVVFN